MNKTLLISASLVILTLSACSKTKTEAVVPPVTTTPTPVTTPPVTTAPDPRPANSLCNSSEKILFNCQISSANRTVSVCSSSTLSNIQYRYGSDAYTLDMRFPQDPSTDRNALSYSSEGLGFSNGSIRYQLYTQGTSAGVKTFWSTDPSRNKILPCTGTITNQLDQLQGVL